MLYSVRIKWKKLQFMASNFSLSGCIISVNWSRSVKRIWRTGHLLPKRKQKSNKYLVSGERKLVMVFKHYQMVMISKHECLPRLAASDRGIVESRGSGMGTPSLSLITLLFLSQMQTVWNWGIIQNNNVEKNKSGVSMNHFREALKPVVVIHRHEGQKQTWRPLKSFIYFFSLDTCWICNIAGLLFKWSSWTPSTPLIFS